MRSLEWKGLPTNTHYFFSGSLLCPTIFSGLRVIVNTSRVLDRGSHFESYLMAQAP